VLAVVEDHQRPPRREKYTGGLQLGHTRQRTYSQSLRERRAD
jgi:hypothetical protein